MTSSGGVDAVSGAELLDTADALARAALEVEARLLVVAAQWAVLNGPETVDAEQAELPGRQTARRYGGAGTPEVASFAPAELGARIAVEDAAMTGEIAFADIAGVAIVSVG